MKLKITLYSLISIIIILVILLGLLVSTTTGLRITLSIAKHYIPGTLNISDVDGSLRGPINLGQLNYDNADFKLSIQKVNINGNLLSLINKNLKLKSLTINGVEYQIKHTKPSKQTSPEKSTNKQNKSSEQLLPIKLNIANATISNIDIIKDQQTTHINQISLQTSTLNNVLKIPNLIATQDEGSLNAKLSLQTIKPYNVEIVAEATGEISDGQKVAGKLQLSGNLQKAILDAKITEPFTSHWQGELINPLQQGPVSLSGNWQNVNWVVAHSTSIISKQGQFDIQGKLSSYQVKLDSDIAGSKVPRGTWHIAGNGDLQHINLTTITAQTLDGSLSGAADLTWKPYLKWQANISGKNINPGAHWKQWQADLTFNASSAGEYQNKQWQANLKMPSLSGTLHKRLVSGKIDVAYAKQHLSINHSELKAGDNLAIVNGDINQKVNLNWVIQAPNIEQIDRQAHGELFSQGQAFGSFQEPNIQSKSAIGNLKVGPLSIKALNGEINFTWAAQGNAFAKIHAQGLEYQSYQVNQLDILNTGSLAKQKMALQLTAPQIKLSAQATGGLINQKILTGSLDNLKINSPEYQNWQLQQATNFTFAAGLAKLDQFCLANQQKQQVCGMLNYQQGKQIIAKLDSQNLNSQLFNPLLPADLTSNIPFSIHLEINNPKDSIPLGSANINSQQGLLAYKLQQKTQQMTLLSSQIKAKFTAQGVNLSSDIKADYNKTITVNLNLPNYQLTAAPADNQAVQGQLKLNIPDLSFLDGLIPQISNTQGSLTTEINIAGTVGVPQINGSLHLNKAQTYVKALGITLKDATLNAKSTANNKILLNGSINSDKGKLSVDGYTTLDKSFDTSLKITGKEVMIMNTDEYEIYLSPDLHIAYKKPRLRISGSLTVPQANLNPKTFSSTVQLPSNIIYIQGNNTEDELLQSYTDLNLKLEHIKFKYDNLRAHVSGNLHIKDTPKTLTTATGQLDITDGVFDAYSQKLLIESGQLLYTGGPISNPLLNIRAIRKISVIGNPELASSGNYLTVGIQITGTLREPKITLFSQPISLSQNDILSYLILGHGTSSSSATQGQALIAAAGAMGLAKTGIMQSLEQQYGLSVGVESTEVNTAQGGSEQNTSLVIGKKINPRLTLEYSAGLILPVNILRLMYQLSPKWMIQTDSSTYDNGADIFYTIQTN